MASTDQNVVNKRDITITFFDGLTYGAATNTYSVSGETGDLSIGGGGVSVETYLDRGEMVGDAGYPLMRKVDDQALTLAFSAYLRKLTDATIPTLRDIAARMAQNPAAVCGAASAWNNAHPASDAFCIGVRISTSRQGSGVAGGFHFDYQMCTGTMEIGDGSPASLSLSLTAGVNAPIISTY